MSMPQAMAVFAHPDDEVVALGARLGRFDTAHFVYITDGAPRNEQDSRAHGFTSPQDYHRARWEELRQAMLSAGLSHATREYLEIPDQEASLCLLQLTHRVHALVEKHQPEVIFTHPYEGGHPDHDACAFAAHHALALRRKQGQSVPLVVEGTFYHAGPNGMTTGSFLPHAQSTQEIEYRLSSEERMRKQALLACFTTQQETLRYFALDFERFRIAPEYDFCRPPHPSPVFYDQYPWGMTSQRFCKLAEKAEDVLQDEILVACR